MEITSVSSEGSLPHHEGWIHEPETKVKWECYYGDDVTIINRGEHGWCLTSKYMGGRIITISELTAVLLLASTTLEAEGWVEKKAQELL